MSDAAAGAQSKRPATLYGRVLGMFGKRPIDQIGEGTIFAGRLRVVNDGFIQIGSNCRFSSHPIQSHFEVMPGGAILIGNRVCISYGAGISALSSVEIGDDTRIGPFCVILDNDYHNVSDLNSRGTASAVHIGNNVNVGARVTILRGTQIEDGATIMSGSTVSGVIKANTVVSGVPARVLKARVEPVV